MRGDREGRWDESAVSKSTVARAGELVKQLQVIAEGAETAGELEAEVVAVVLGELLSERFGKQEGSRRGCEVLVRVGRDGPVARRLGRHPRPLHVTVREELVLALVVRAEGRRADASPIRVRVGRRGGQDLVDLRLFHQDEVVGLFDQATKSGFAIPQRAVPALIQLLQATAPRGKQR